MDISLIVGLIGVAGAYPVYKGWFLNLLNWNQKATLKNLKSQLADLESFHNDPAKVIGWAMEGIFFILALISITFLSTLFHLDTEASKGTYIVSSFVGLLMYIVALSKWGFAMRLKHYERTKKRLELKIQKYET